jgi:exodeoxyribonuclease VII small subunit
MSDPTPEPSFEESLAELERMVRELEDGRLGLDESLARYEQGVGLIKRCSNQLREAERRILLVTGMDENGRPVLQAFQHEATAVTRAEPARRVRKKTDEIDGLFRQEPRGDK